MQEKETVGIRADEQPAPSSIIINVEGKATAFSGGLNSLNNLVNDWCTTGDFVRLDRWLKHDTWSTEEAFLLMNGLDPKGTKVRKHPGLYSFVEETYIDEFEIITILDGRSINLPIFGAIYSALVKGGIRDKNDKQVSLFKSACWNALNRVTEMREIFVSGNHPERNPPAYYLSWAAKKGFGGDIIDEIRQKIGANEQGNSEMGPGAESDACLERKEADPLSNDDESPEQAESIEGPKHRITKNQAILQTFIDEGKGTSIETVWVHINSNAGKENFPFSGASKDRATLIDGKEVKKTNMGKTLGRMLHKKKTISSQ